MIPPRRRVPVGAERRARDYAMGLMEDPMFDISSAYGRGIRTSLGQLGKLQKQQTAEGMRTLTATGGSPEQLLRFQQQAYEGGLGAAGDVLSSGTQAQAGAIFGATEARNQMAAQLAEQERNRQFEEQMLGRQQSFQERMARQEYGWSEKARKEQEKAARRNAWLGFFGDVAGAGLSALLPMLG